MGLSLHDIGSFELERWLSSARTIEDFSSRIINLLKPIGVTDFSHAYARAAHSILDPIGTFDPEVTDRYAREGFQHDDLAAQYLLANQQPLFRSTIDQFVETSPVELPTFKRNREVLKFLGSYGIHDIYSFPIVGPDNYYALFSITSRNCPAQQFRSIVGAHLGAVHLLAELVDSIGIRKFKNHFKREKLNPRLPISNRPLELVEVLANKDLTLNEAAEVLNMSISTANQHIAAAKKALGVSTTHGLVVAAQKEGLIAVER